MACIRRARLWRNGRNGILGYVGNYNVASEFVRLIEQSLLAYGTVIASVPNVRVILVVVSVLMACASISAVWHQVRLSWRLDGEHP